MASPRDQDPTVKISRPKDGILLATLSRPKSRNAVNGAMIKELVACLEAASEDPSVHGVVITGDPQGKAFCAGADLSPEANNFGSDKSQPKPSEETFRDGGGISSLALLRCRKPVICAINGAAVGWGLAFTLAADMRVVAETAKIGFTMAARGLVNESLSSVLLPRLIGSGLAKEMVFTGRVMRAKDAPQGLFNYVVPQEQVVDKALELAAEIATNSSRLAVAVSKGLMNAGWNVTEEEAFLLESQSLYQITYGVNGDLKEGIAAFLEKRQPAWRPVKREDLDKFDVFKKSNL